MKVHVLIRGDLLNMRLEGVFTASGVNCRMGQPAEQVPALSGKFPPGNERNKRSRQDGDVRHLRVAPYEATHRVIEQKSAEAILA